MRRLLAILLMVFLPLQFSWAAVATYCEHEAAGDTQHLGHHEHEHHGAATGMVPDAMLGMANDAPEKNASTVADIDCTHCHAQVAALPIIPIALPISLSASHAAPLSDARRVPLALTPPERPQWPALA